MNSDHSRDSDSIASSSPRRGSFTQDDDDRQAPGPSRSDNAYRPIRRINQACNACRRRKSRCTGGRPCRSCRRLDEVCEYPNPGVRASARRRSSASQQQQIRVAGLVGEVLPDLPVARGSVVALAAEERMTAIETRLDDISQQLRQLTELTRQICTAKVQTPGSSNAAPRLDTNNFGSFIDPLPSQHWAVKLEHLIPDTTIRAIFRDYFTLAHNQPYSFFHETTFYTRYDVGLLPDHLVLAVLSHAMRFSDHIPRDRSRQMSVLFANMAWKSIVHLYFQERVDADLAAVQTITLLSIFDFTAGHERHDQAWVKIGLAIRISQDLRLMIDDESLLLSYAEREERRRVFWSVYMLDRLASVRCCDILARQILICL
ncbi:fungal-specific transcription factor domain-containing protein [Plectosphaerella plurivora]|uniref:Fungal-specific transcription factor domain-containing protein n=1 Tax=Plectosphaerella plurivora TaxID=936078 RepID=A0A9P8V160_9PEZI|nr:fungal-specific transcription factor domain-containing protein [Plectosphaerella plurivora]